MVAAAVPPAPQSSHLPEGSTRTTVARNAPGEAAREAGVTGGAEEEEDDDPSLPILNCGEIISKKGENKIGEN